MNKLLLIDGHAYAYRSFYAIKELKSPEGMAVNAIYGFIKALTKMRSDLGPTHVLVVWDGGLSAERLKRWPAYKAQRPSMPDDLRPQFERIRHYLSAAGVADFCADGVEADDHIGCVARLAADAGWQVIIASADKDFMQLVDDRIGLLNPNDKSGMVWGADQVRAKSGVDPGQVADWLALMGDQVDNIPGVPGVGPKTAASLLGQFGSVDKIYERIAEVKSPRLAAALDASKPLVYKNLDLVRLQSVPCEFIPDQVKPGAEDTPRLQDLLAQFGFKGMLRELMESKTGRLAGLN